LEIAPTIWLINRSRPAGSTAPEPSLLDFSHDFVCQTARFSVPQRWGDPFQCFKSRFRRVSWKGFDGLDLQATMRAGMYQISRQKQFFQAGQRSWMSYFGQGIQGCQFGFVSVIEKRRTLKQLKKLFQDLAASAMDGKLYGLQANFVTTTSQFFENASFHLRVAKGQQGPYHFLTDAWMRMGQVTLNSGNGGKFFDMLKENVLIISQTQI